MSWVVDTCLLIDILENDPVFMEGTASLLETKLSDGLVVCPVTYVELAPSFLGDGHRQREFLDTMAIAYDYEWTWANTQCANKAWNRQTQLRRNGLAAKRPIADILIGAFAQGHQGLLTRNAGDFRGVFPTLHIETP